MFGLRLWEAPTCRTSTSTLPRFSRFILHRRVGAVNSRADLNNAQFINQCLAPSDCVHKRTPKVGMNTSDPGHQGDGHNVPIAVRSADHSESTSNEMNRGRSPSPEGLRPPLPPRPNTLNLLNDESASRATLQSEATTAVSREEIDTQKPDGIDNAYSTLAVRNLSRGPKAKASLSQIARSRATSDAGDSASIRSSIPNGDVGDMDMLFKDFITSAPDAQSGAASLLHFAEFPGDDVDDAQFLTEFEPVGEIDENVGNEGAIQINLNSFWI